MPITGMTFTSLVQDIKDTIERGNAADETTIRQIPRQINNTERLLAQRLKITGYLGVFTSALQTGQSVLAKPQNWRSTASINIGTGASFVNRKTLRERSYEYMRAIYPDATVNDEPVFYCDYNIDTWLVLPTPADNYPFEANVYLLPDLLSDENQQNYLTRYAPFLLLWSTLASMEAFMRNDSRIETWKMLAGDAFDAVNAEDIRRMVDRSMARATN